MWLFNELNESNKIKSMLVAGQPANQPQSNPNPKPSLSASINVERRGPCQVGGQANQIKQQTYLPGGNCNGTRNRKQTEFEQLKLEDWRSGGLKDWRTELLETKDQSLGVAGIRSGTYIAFVYPADTFDALLTQSHSICFGSLERWCNCCCLPVSGVVVPIVDQIWTRPRNGNKDLGPLSLCQFKGVG